MSNISQLTAITKDAQQAAKQMYMVNESLGKYLAKQGKTLKTLGDLRKIATKQGKEIDRWKGVIKTTEKLAKKSDGVVTKLTKGLFKQVNPKLGATVNSVGMLASAGITVLAIKSQEYIQEIDLRQNTVKEAELNRTAKKLRELTVGERQVQNQIKDIKARIDNTNADTARAARQASDASKSANDALYETRKGREILEVKHKQQNDLLYEHKVKLQEHVGKLKQHNDLLYAEKQERLKLGIQFVEQKTTTESKIQQLKQQFQQITATTAKGATEGIQATIAQLKQGVQEAKQESKSAKDYATTVQKTLELSKALTEAIKRGLEVTTLKAENALAEALKNGATLKLVDGKIQVAAEQAAKTYGAKVWEPKIYGTEGRIATLATGQVAIASDVAQFKEEAKQKVGKVEFKAEIETLEQQNTRLKQEIDQLKNSQKATDSKITDTQQQIKEQEKVNKDGVKQLEKLIPMVGAIPGLITAQGQLTRNKIPTLPQIQETTETAICNSTANGCMLSGLNGAADRAANQVNANTNDKFGALNATLQGADLAMLGVINNKLGNQVDGGLSGMLKRFSENAIVTRTLNLMILATTLHNALMLSNNLGQTLMSIINNVLGFFGVKNGEGQNVDVGQVIGSGIENFIKSLIGNEAYTKLSNDLAKANRIYQATTNLLNQVQNLHNSVLSALEVGFGWTAKIGNALKVWGVVGERVYGWMNPQPNFKWKAFAYLETAQQGASTVEVIVASVVDVKEQVVQLANTKTELEQALGNQSKDLTATKAPEAEKVKEEQLASKAASQGAATSLSDIFNANE